MKLLVGALFVAASLSLFRTVATGIIQRKRPGRTLMRHRRLANWTLGFWLLAIVATEVYVRLSHGVKWTAFFGFHLAFAATALGCFLAARFVWTGLKNPARHRAVVYTCSLTYLIALASGSILLARMP